MCPSLITPGDELPAGRRKLIHPVGVVGRVEWRDKGGHPYTGIFKGSSRVWQFVLMAGFFLG